MRVVVTGAAGFIGSHVAEAMAGAGHHTMAVDAPFRSTCPAAAERNWAGLAAYGRITRIEKDLVTEGLDRFAEADAIVHLAGRPGVRASWGHGEAATRRDNIQATRRLLDVWTCCT